MAAGLVGACQAEPGKGGAGAERSPVAATVQEPTSRPGGWLPPAGFVQTPLWPGAAPDMAGLTLPAESVLVAQTPQALKGATSEAAQNVSTPTMTVFPARGKPNGAAVVV